MQVAETFEPERQAAKFVLPAKDTLNGENRSWKIASSKIGLRPRFMNFRPLGLGLMFGTMPRLKIAFRLRGQS
jgi:hypothetical protein